MTRTSSGSIGNGDSSGGTNVSMRSSDRSGSGAYAEQPDEVAVVRIGGGSSSSSQRKRRRGSVAEYVSLRRYGESASPADTIRGTCAGGVVTGSVEVQRQRARRPARCGAEPRLDAVVESSMRSGNRVSEGSPVRQPDLGSTASRNTSRRVVAVRRCRATGSEAVGTTSQSPIGLPAVVVDLGVRLNRFVRKMSRRPVPDRPTSSRGRGRT